MLNVSGEESKEHRSWCVWNEAGQNPHDSTEHRQAADQEDEGSEENTSGEEESEGCQ